MFDAISYNYLILDFFQYFAIGTASLAILFVIMAVRIPTRRSDFFWVACTFLTDFFFLFVSNYYFSRSLNNHPLISTKNGNLMVVRGVMILAIWEIYLLTRLTYFILVTREDQLRYEQPILTRNYHLLQWLFPDALILLLVIQIIAIIILLLYGLSSFFCPTNVWAMQDAIDIQNFTSFEQIFTDNVTSILNKTSPK